MTDDEPEGPPEIPPEFTPEELELITEGMGPGNDDDQEDDDGAME